MIQFTEEVTEDGVTARSFDLTVAGDRVPAVLWTPVGAEGPRPLVLAGHGGSQHKRAPGIVSRAKDYARRYGFATLALDAPGHGDRVTAEQAAAFAAEAQARIASAEGFNEAFVARMAATINKAVPEWTAGLDAVQALQEVGADQPVAYWGLSMASAIGIQFVAGEPRVTAAIFGLCGLRPGHAELADAAHRITCPVQFVFQWDDAIIPREQGLDLYNAFSSTEKAMHINPGGHSAIPAHEGPCWEDFLKRHLTGAKTGGVLQAA